MALPVFDEKEPCTKCAGKVLEVRYEHQSQPGFLAEREWDTEGSERLRIRCLRCGFETLRAPLA